MFECAELFVTSMNEEGYPRTCCVSILHAADFHDLYFATSKGSKYQGKANHFESNTKSSVCYQKHDNSVTLIGEIDLITTRAIQEKLWNESNRKFFSKGIDDPKFRFYRFHTKEATFWIDSKFRTVKCK